MIQARLPLLLGSILLCWPISGLAAQESTPTLSREELAAIVDEARSAGLLVAAHAATDEAIRRAVEAVVETIEHGDDDDLNKNN